QRRLPRRRQAQPVRRRGLDRAAAAAGAGDPAAAQPPDVRAGRAAHDRLRALRAGRGHRRCRVVPAAAAALRRHRRLARAVRAERAGAGLARHARAGALRRHDRAHLEVPGHGGDPHARGAAGHPARRHRGSRDRRRLLVADPVADHDPAAGPDDAHLGVPVDDRVAAAVRHGLDPHARRPGQRHHDDGDIPAHRGPAPRQLRDRLGGVGGAVRHRARDGADPSALHPQPRQHRRLASEGEAMTATTLPGTRVRRRARRDAKSRNPLVYVAALVVVALSLGPVLVGVIGGFRTNAQLAEDPAGLPDPWVLDNYLNVITGAEFWRYTLNSTAIALITTGLVVLLGVMAAYPLARYRFRGREALFTIFVMGLLFPATVAIIPLFIIVTRDLGLGNTWWGVALPQAAFALPLTVVILRPFLAAIPTEIEEAALLDGASRLGFFWRILLPLSGPGMVTVGVLAF